MPNPKAETGRMAGLIAGFDWASTPLGAIDGWPQSLKTVVDVMLGSGHAMQLAWGPERTVLYNDAYAPMLGNRHPGALGLPFRIAWPDIWEEIEPLVARVFAGETVRFEDMPLVMTRHGYAEDTWWNFSYSPVRDEAGAIAGLLNVTVDATPRVRAERAEQARDEANARLQSSEKRQAFLLRLSDALRPLADAGAVKSAAARLLGEHLKVNRAFYSDVEGDDWVIRGDHEQGVVPLAPGRYPAGTYGEWMMETFRRGEVLDFSDAQSDPRFGPPQRAALARLQVTAALGVGLVKGGTLRAVLTINSAAPRAWTAEEAALLGEVAERTWAAVERASAEAALRESEQRFRALVTAGTYSIYRMSPDWRLMYALDSDTLAPTAAPIEDWVDRYIPEEDRPRVFAAIGEAIRTRSLFELEHRVRLADGGTGWVISRAVPLLGPDGEITEWFGAGSDVTERRMAVEKLRESEERLRQFGEASQDVLWIRDAETLQWQYLTPAFETIYGLGREEALAGNNYRSWLDLILPEDRARATESIRRVRAGENATFDYRIRRPRDGMIRWLRNTDFPIADETGKVVLVGGIGHDLTELREAELRLQALIEGIPQLVWRAGDGGAWTWASPQWTDYTGLSEAESRGWGWLEALHPDDRPRAREAWGHAMERGGFEVEYRVRRAGGHAGGDEHRWFQTRATPVRDDTGAIVEWLGTSTDIHELRALQERQRVLVTELQHRTRNLMGVVRTMADRTGQASADLPDFRHRFRGRMEALSRVQGLLSRLHDTDRVAFDELIRTQIDAMDGTGDRVTLDGPAGIRLRSSMVQMLAMALHELATNALKYGALGQPGAHLAISWRMVAPDRRGWPRLHIDWRESGVRMPSGAAGPLGSGQGRELIEKALPYQLDAETSFELGPDGVRCAITIPVSASNMEGPAHG